MKIDCKCGNCIHDISDFQSDKAWLIPDKNWENFWSEIYNAIKQSGKSKVEKEYAANSVGRTSSISAYRAMYQCNTCGRIYINNESGTLEVFEPESENTCKTVLNSLAIYTYDTDKIFKGSSIKRRWWKFW